MSTDSVEPGIIAKCNHDCLGVITHAKGDIKQGVHLTDKKTAVGGPWQSVSPTVVGDAEDLEAAFDEFYNQPPFDAPILNYAARKAIGRMDAMSRMIANYFKRHWEKLPAFLQRKTKEKIEKADQVDKIWQQVMQLQINS